MRLIVEYVRGRAGDRGVRRLLQLAGEMRSERELCDEGQWSKTDCLHGATSRLKGCYRRNTRQPTSLRRRG